LLVSFFVVVVFTQLSWMKIFLGWLSLSQDCVQGLHSFASHRSVS
jgi:hypothetical protein